MKKVLSVFLCLALLFGLFSSLSVSATREPVDISITSASGLVGDTVSVDLMLNENPGFSVLGVYVQFDKTKLQLEDVTDKMEFEGYDNVGKDTRIVDANQWSKYSIVWTDNIFLTPVTETGLLATFHFKILEGASGDIPITISVQNCFDSNMNEFPRQLTNGAITACKYVMNVDYQDGWPPESIYANSGMVVDEPYEYERLGCILDGWYTEPVGGEKITFPITVSESSTIYAHWIITAKPGDINGDDVVDLMDVTALSRYVAGWMIFDLVDVVMDVNADGELDLKDVTMLSRQVAGWDVVAG